MTGKLIVIVGSGPGIGATTAAHFASKGFNVALLSRNGERLKTDADTVRKAAGDASIKVNAFAVDVGDHQALIATLDKVKSEMGIPEVVLFNAAKVAKDAPSVFGEIPVEILSESFQVMNVGLYVTATWAVPLLESVKQQKPDSHPSFFITGGGIWKAYLPFVFVLSMQKAAQVNFAGCLAQIAGPKGIHVATVSVNGLVSDDAPVTNAKNVASTFWDLYLQKSDVWENMVDLGAMEGVTSVKAADLGL